MKTKNDIIQYFSNLPEVIRIKELENYIDNNKQIKSKFNEIKSLQKHMMNAKEFNQMNQYHEYEKEYSIKKKELLELPFVEEYLELLDIVSLMLENLTNGISNKIDKMINK